MADAAVQKHTPISTPPDFQSPAGLCIGVALVAPLLGREGLAACVQSLGDTLLTMSTSVIVPSIFCAVGIGIATIVVAKREGAPDASAPQKAI